MIDETSRLNEHAINDNLLDEGNNLESLLQIDSVDQKQSKEAERHTSYFFIELFICSLLLWSLLFMSKSNLGIRITSYVSHILKEECSIEVVQAFEIKLKEAIKQII